MYDYSYVCVGGVATRKLASFDDIDVYECSLQFVDEHGHKLAAVENAIVTVCNGQARLQQYAQNFLPAEATDEDYEKWEQLLEGYPGYDVYNEDELAGLLGFAS